MKRVANFLGWFVELLLVGAIIFVLVAVVSPDWSQPKIRRLAVTKAHIFVFAQNLVADQPCELQETMEAGAIDSLDLSGRPLDGYDRPVQVFVKGGKVYIASCGPDGYMTLPDREIPCQIRKRESKMNGDIWLTVEIDNGQFSISHYR